MFGLGLCYAGLLVNGLLNCLSLWLLVQLPLLIFCLGLGFWPASRLLVLSWAGLGARGGTCLGLDLGWLGSTWFFGLFLYMTL